MVLPLLLVRCLEVSSQIRRLGGMFPVPLFGSSILWMSHSNPNNRWCFLINLPIGAITVLVILIFFKAPDREAVTDLPWSERIKEFDLLGTAFFIPAIICLLLALQWGGTKYPWGNGRIIALFVLFGILVGIFIAIQFWKGDSATVPPNIIKKRSMWSAAWFSFCLGSYFLLLIYYLPIWFQAVKGDSAVKSGISNIPMVLTLVIVRFVKPPHF